MVTDSWVVDGVRLAAWEAPDGVREFELTYEVNSETELRGIVAAFGGIQVFTQGGTADRLLSCEGRTEHDREVRVYVHLEGPDFRPPTPTPPGVVERMRAEATTAREAVAS